MTRELLGDVDVGACIERSAEFTCSASGKRAIKGLGSSTEESMAMASLTWTRSKALHTATLLAVLLAPIAASAGWGDENWGEMVWGGGVLPLPSLSLWGQIALAVLLLALPGRLLLRRCSGAKS
jgi:hypothetical protein